jgi:hypothetical protein
VTRINCIPSKGCQIPLTVTFWLVMHF